jgi:hypothetical protein
MDTGATPNCHLFYSVIPARSCIGRRPAVITAGEPRCTPGCSPGMRRDSSHRRTACTPLRQFAETYSRKVALKPRFPGPSTDQVTAGRLRSVAVASTQPRRRQCAAWCDAQHLLRKTASRVRRRRPVHCGQTRSTKVRRSRGPPPGIAGLWLREGLWSGSVS